MHPQHGCPHFSAAQHKTRFNDEIYFRFQITFQASNETGQQKLNKQKRISTNQATCALDSERKLANFWQSN